MSKFDILLLSEKNIFNIDDLSALWKQNKRVETVWSIKQYVKSGKIHRLRRGLYIIDNSKLDSYILANKALTPSYITGLTVLQKYGLSFQFTNTIHSAAKKTKSIEIKYWHILKCRKQFHCTALDFQ
jgi:predicted transcriptional regulator of viral defense system